MIPNSVEGGKYSCETSITMVQGSDEGSYSCSAVWSDDAQPEPSNEIDIRVMGALIICKLFTTETSVLHLA